MFNQQKCSLYTASAALSCTTFSLIYSGYGVTKAKNLRLVFINKNLINIVLKRLGIMEIIMSKLWSFSGQFLVAAIYHARWQRSRVDPNWTAALVGHGYSSNIPCWLLGFHKEFPFSSSLTPSYTRRNAPTSLSGLNKESKTALFVMCPQA